jgi:hypothetical protein
VSDLIEKMEAARNAAIRAAMSCHQGGPNLEQMHIGMRAALADESGG